MPTAQRSAPQALLALLVVALLLAIGSGEGRAEIADDPMQICPVPVGTAIPSVQVREMDGTEISFSDALAGQPAVILIYRGGWCPYCNAHLSEMATIEPDLYRLGYQVLAVSPDTPPHVVTTDAGLKQGYTLLSDSDLALAQALGIVFRLDDEMVEKYLEYGIDLEQASGRDHHLLPVPAAIVVDREGIIRFMYVNPDYKARVDAKVLLAAAKAYK